MNITFLIGNGFDRNLGLDTTYSDFVAKYKKTTGTTQTLNNFRAYIQANEELWSAAEIALGQYTSKFDAGQAEAFSECQADFCELLAVYLKEQEQRIVFEANEAAIDTAFSRLNSLIQVFPSQERTVLNNVYLRKKDEEINFHFICFNYTKTLDKCLDIVKKKPNILGTHQCNNRNIRHSVGQICHVHGTVDKEMVFGVNDETQIAKLDVFECDDGDLYKNMLIKIQANASYLENTDETAAKMIQSSQIIYVYGMSIGDTDKLWWDRLCAWLVADDLRHLIVQKHSMPSKGVFPIRYQVFERQCRKEITQHCNLEQSRKENIEHRIHVTGENIFEAIQGLAKLTQPVDMTLIEQAEKIAAVIK